MEGVLARTKTAAEKYAEARRIADELAEAEAEAAEEKLAEEERMRALEMMESAKRNRAMTMNMATRTVAEKYNNNAVPVRRAANRETAAADEWPRNVSEYMD